MQPLNHSGGEGKGNWKFSRTRSPSKNETRCGWIEKVKKIFVIVLSRLIVNVKVSLDTVIIG